MALIKSAYLTHFLLFKKSDTSFFDGVRLTRLYQNKREHELLLYAVVFQRAWYDLWDTKLHTVEKCAIYLINQSVYFVCA